MVARALIIAIEEYPRAAGLATRLEGTQAAGDTFRKWFIDTKHGGVDPGPDFLRFCAAQGHPGATGGTSRNEILDELDALVQAGKDRTSELFFFFSGHGVAFEERPGRPRIDVLIASDFVDLARGGRACIPVADLQEKVQSALGPGDHYYFLDACRNVVGPRAFTPLPIDNTWEPSRSGIACVLTLYSTRSGARASTRSGFADTLVAGLRGAGKAKEKLDATRMVVTFDRLARYIRSRMPDQEPVFANPQGCDGVIRELSPIPKSRCSLTVEGASNDEKLTLVVSDPNGDYPDRPVSFDRAPREVPLNPNDYGLRLLDATGSETFERVEPPGPAPVDMWDDREVVFIRASSRSLPARGLTASLRLRAPLGASVAVFRDGGGKVLEETMTYGGIDRVLGAGDYHLEVTERGSLLSRRDIQLAPGETREIELRSDAAGSVRDRILQATGNDPRAPLHQVSESLGPFADARLGLLLSLIGASRIVEPHDHFEKLRHLPLQTFAGSRPGTSAVYVLAAFSPGAAPADPVCLGLHRGPKVAFRAATPVAGIPGLWELRIDAPPGPYMLSFSAPGQRPLTLATHVLLNRATLVTLSDGDEPGDIEAHQYLLPIHGCRSGLMHEELAHLEQSAPLRFIRLLWHVQNLFSMKRKVAVAPEDKESWSHFSVGKWLDPMMGILVAYELVRRGGLEDSHRNALRIITHNLDRHFGDIPDVQVIRKLVTGDWARPAQPPLVRQGLLSWSLDGGPAPAPLPRERLLVSGMWTAWLDAVPAAPPTSAAAPVPAG